MSLHAYTRCWTHLIWGTLRREKTLMPKETRRQVSQFLFEYAQTKSIFMRSNYVNADHIHALVDVPPTMSLQEAVKLLKGASSHFVNKERLVAGKFAWGRGYGAFSVSHSNLGKVIAYIANQEEHHRVKPFSEEYESFIRAYELEFRPEKDETVETVSTDNEV